VRLKPARGLGWLVRLGRVVPALIAVYELRYVLAHLASTGAALAGTDHAYLRSLQPWVMALLALGTGSLLLQIGRGLRGHIGRPRWSASLVALWSLCFSALVALLCCQSLLTSLLGAGHPVGLSTVLGAGTWSSIAAALGVGLVLAVSVGGARWILGKVAGRRRRKVAPRRRGVGVVRFASGELRPAPVPVLAGWSDRGPPPVTLAFV
jgi:hypothetical protein